MITISKKRNSDQEFYDGLIIKALKESKQKDNLKERLLRKIKIQRSEILKIKRARDKYYAHLDSEHLEVISEKFLMKNVEIIIFAIQNVIHKLYGTTKLKNVLFKIPSREEFNLVEELRPGLKR